MLRIACLAVVLFVNAAVGLAQAPDGAALYKANCASCHDPGDRKSVV